MQKMPLIFIGHGSPMNAIEINQYTESWKKLGNSIPRPRAILIFSAHWITQGETRISTNDHPSMIYDMSGFPPELYNVQYTALGSIHIAKEIKNLLEQDSDIDIQEDGIRGFDHGVWSTLIHLFPLADIPIICVSLDYSAPLEQLYKIGQKLAILREQGILIVASGNIVHNLSRIDWSGKIQYPWAVEFDLRIANAIKSGKDSKEFIDILDFQSWGEISKLAHPSHDHLLPLFPLLGLVDRIDSAHFFTPDIVMGSLAMRSIVWGL